MKEVKAITESKFKLRQGFVTLKRGQYDQSDYVRGLFMQLGYINPYSGGNGVKLSEVLKRTKIAHITGAYSDESGACALGALLVEAGMPYNGKTPNWDKFYAWYGLTHDNFNAEVKCPDCTKVNHISGLIPHINDVHNREPAYIGSWLEKYGL